MEQYLRELVRYEPDRTAAAYRTAVQTPDSVNVSSIGSVPVYSLVSEEYPVTAAKKVIGISGRFSSSSGATSIWIVKGYVNTYGHPGTYANTFVALAVEPLDLAFEATNLTDGTDYWSKEFIFDGLGCAWMKVCVGEVAAGNVDLWVRRA